MNRTFAPLALFAACLGSLAAAPERPNVIFFLVDDMGWTDSSLYGSLFYESPGLERLAETSTRFTNAYAASPLCSPARASILSGQYPARHGMTTAWGHTPLRDDPDYQTNGVPRSSPYLLPTSKRYLDPEQYTLAEAFRDAGYRTGFVGKWHMGLDERFWPEEQGFDFTFHGAPDPGPPSYFSPYDFRFGNITPGPEGEYLTDRATDEAIGFIEEDPDAPFFLCLWHWGVHTPLQAEEAWKAHYEGREDPTGRHRSPTFAAMLRAVDLSLEELLDFLDEAGLARNTILVFTSDNGGLRHVTVPGEGVPATSNEPLRSGKGTLFEGGSRVPLLIRWPGVTGGGVSDEPVTGVDFYPTLLEMAGLPMPEQQTVDGVSLAPLLRDGEPLAREAIFSFFPHNFGERSPAGAWVREGDWKLIEVFYHSDLWPERYELYNLADDLGEYRNVAGEHPERVERMAAMLRGHYAELSPNPPKPNPDFDPAEAPVAGWKSGRNQPPPERVDGALHLAGNSISTRGLPRVTGDLILSWRMKSPRGGGGRLFYSDRSKWPFDAERRIDFEVADGGEWGNYTVRFSVPEELIGLRIDVPNPPASAAVEIDDVRLRRADGGVLTDWTFDPDRSRPSAFPVERLGRVGR